MQVFFNSDGTSVTAYITIIDTSGAHVDPDSWPITNDPAIVLSSHPSAAKTVTAVDTGVYKVVWTGLSPALSHGDVVHISIDGAISGTAWSTWIVPIQVVLLPPVNGATVNANVTSMDADTLTASALAADAVAEIAASVDISSQLAAVIEDTEDIQSRLPAALVDGRMLSYADTLSEGFGDSLSSYLADDIASGNWDWPSAILVIQAGLSTLDAAGIRAAMGLAAANLDTQLSATNTNVDSAELNILDAVSSITVDNAAIASAVRSELAAELGRIDADVSSRLAASAYTGSKVVVPISALPFQVVRKYNNTAILRRFASFSWTLNNVGSLTGVQKIVFTIKDKRDSEADSASVLQIVASIPENAASDGVTYVNKESGSAVRTSGKITVQAYMDDFVERHRIVIEASDKVTALIDNYDNCTFDVKQIMADDSDILEEGILVIQGVSTRLISS